MRLLI